MEHSSPHYDISCLLPNSQVGAGCFQEKYQLFASTNLPVMFGLMGFILKFIFMIISKPSLDVIKADFSCPPKKSRDDFFFMISNCKCYHDDLKTNISLGGNKRRYSV